MNETENKKSILSKIAFIGFLISALIIVLTIAVIVIMSMPYRTYPERIICASNEKQLAVAILTNSGHLNQEADHWCDFLIQHNYATKKEFICPSASYNGDKGPCHYALNPNCEPNSPADTVLLFETKGGWNQHGGPELLAFDHHGNKSCWIAFNDGHVEFIKAEDIGKLKWKAEANEMKQPAFR